MLSRTVKILWRTVKGKRDGARGGAVVEIAGEFHNGRSRWERRTSRFRREEGKMVDVLRIPPHH